MTLRAVVTECHLVAWAFAHNPSAVRWRRSVLTLEVGHPGSDTHRPGRSPRALAGVMGSCIHTCSMGSSSIPLGSSFSHRSHQRTHSWRKPIRGPGAACCGQAWGHGPISPFLTPRCPSRKRGTAFV